jgi:hypothetical protein
VDAIRHRVNNAAKRVMIGDEGFSVPKGCKVRRSFQFFPPYATLTDTNLLLLHY